MNSSLHHAPYIRHPESCRTIMGDTLISLLPLYFMSYFYYGPRVLVIGAVAVLTCLAADWLCSYLTYRRVNLRDLSAAVTGVIISMLMPPAIDLTVIVVASLFAILVCKAPFGGTGHNIFNPAAAGVAFAIICWNPQMFAYTQPLQRLPVTIDQTVTLLQGPTATLKLGGIPRLGLTELFLGNFPGPLGSTYTLIIFAGLVYLIARNLAKWYTTLSFLLPIAVLSAINHPYGVSPLESIANEVFAGSLFFVAVYIINDPVTTPKYRIARVIYGLCAGLLTMVFRYYSPLEFSAVFAVLLMNALAPAFDTLCEFLIPWMSQQEQLPDNRTEQGGKQG